MCCKSLKINDRRQTDEVKTVEWIELKQRTEQCRLKKKVSDEYDMCK